MCWTATFQPEHAQRSRGKRQAWIRTTPTTAQGPALKGIHLDLPPEAEKRWWLASLWCHVRQEWGQ